MSVRDNDGCSRSDWEREAGQPPQDVPGEMRTRSEGYREGIYPKQGLG